MRRFIDTKTNAAYDVFMRTTIDIDDALMSDLRQKARENGLSLKDIINRVIRIGLKKSEDASHTYRYKCPEFSLGESRYYDLDKALDLAEYLESEEISRKLKLRK